MGEGAVAIQYLSKVDLAYQEEGRLVVLDFKTDRELADELDHYTNQLKIYGRALAQPGQGVSLKLVRL